MPLTAQQLRRYQIQDALVYWVYIPAAVLGGGWLLDRLASLPPLPPSRALTVAAWVLIGLGVIIIQLATRDLARYGDGTPNPKAPALRLVTQGSYALCRHPMFLGYDLASLGVVLLCRSWGMLSLSWPVMVLFQIRFLRSEELVLARRFGDQWEAYRRRVSLLLPLPRLRRDPP
jgi:protein-S-isoprenylcysteine O-methyltransferase Ste14